MFSVDRRREAVIVETVRTPFGRADRKRGFLRNWRSDDLGVHLLRAIVDRAGVAPGDVDEVILGAVELIGEQAHPGRNVAFLADFPVHVAGLTVERACVTPMSAIHIAAMSVMCGLGDVYLAGGIDSMTHLAIPVMRADMDMFEIINEPGTLMSAQNPNPRLFEKLNPMELTGGVAAEKLCAERGITRRRMDEWAHRSHLRAVAAQEAGRFAREIVPLEAHLPDGAPFTMDRDQLPRPDSSVDKIASLPTIFQLDGGRINAASSAGQADGAAVVMVMAREAAERRGLTPLATIRGIAVAGCDPTDLVYSAVPATQKLLARTGTAARDIDLLEVNEAFACAPMVVMDEIGLPDEERVNVDGGACALGHPVGATGARLVGHLALELRRRGARLGVAAICGGYGQGGATLIEVET